MIYTSYVFSLALAINRSQVSMKKYIGSVSLFKEAGANAFDKLPIVIEVHYVLL